MMHFKKFAMKNPKCPRNIGDIGFFGDMGTGRNSVKSREIA